MSAEKSSEIFKLVKKNVTDEYFMRVLYYHVRKALIETNFKFGELDAFTISGKYFGEDQTVGLNRLYHNILKSLNLVLSLRALMINPQYLKYAHEGNFFFDTFDKKYLPLDSHRIIIECLRDEDFSTIYNMIIGYLDSGKISDELKDSFAEKTISPERLNLEVFCKKLASRSDYHGRTVIKNKAFLCSDIEQYVIEKYVDYVGDTAFAYCANLKKLEFKSKVLFGYFPIIECSRLRQIIVPTELLDYYKQELPYYKDIITDHELEIIEEPPVEKTQPEERIELTDVEDVYVEVPSADSYIDVEEGPEVEVEEIADEKPETEPEANFSTIKTIFDKKATSYKYFWFLAIISLAKEHDVLAVTYKDIVIRMAAMAWPLVFEDELSLGKSDMMASYLSSVQKATRLIPAATSNVVENHIKMHYESKGIDKLLSPLLKNVPYRFLSPWVKYTSDAEVVAESNRRDFTGMYALLDDRILLNEDWWDYIQDHYNELCRFATQSFLDYAKQYNDAMKLLKFRTTGFNFVGMP